MSEAQRASAWDELAKIDYFLDQLARAVERGEAPRETYDTLAPRYLARREALVAEVTRPTGMSRPASPVDRVAAPTVEPRQRRAPREVRWTQVLAYTGAFLVVVAAAIFTVAVWESVSTTVKLGFLTAFTAAFYTAGILVWRSGLHGGGVALTAVGSAMLLFDGWIAIDGYGVSGPWPWAALFLLLSGVYWLTETRLAGRFFGVTGLAAQIGWWWLAGQGLGWDIPPRIAVVAAVAVGWSYVAERVRDREEFASLASVLRVAAPLTVAGSVLVALMQLSTFAGGWTGIVSAGVIAVSATAVSDRLVAGGLRWAGALGWLPLLVAVGAAPDPFSWGSVGVLVIASSATGIYELLRGGLGHGVAALVFEFFAWFVFATHLALPDDATVALFASVAVTWVLASRLMSRDAPGTEAPTIRYVTAFAPVVGIGGWLLLGGATLALPEALWQVSGHDWALPFARSAALVAYITLAWLASARIMRAWPAAVLGVSGSLVTLALLMDGWFPDIHVAYVGCSLVAVAAAWLHLPRVAEWLYAPWLSRAVSWVAGGALFVLPATAWLVAFDSGWPVIALMLSVIALWVSEAVRFKSPWMGVPISLGLVMTATFAGDLIDVGPHVLGSPVGAVAGTVVGALLCAGSALFHIARPAVRDVAWWALPAASATTVAALWPAMMLIGPRYADVASPLALTFTLAAAGWALSARTVGKEWPYFPSALSLWVALMAALSSLGVSPWVTLATLSLYAIVLFAPSLLMARPASHASPAAPGIAAALASVAVIVAIGTVALGVQSYSGDPLWAGWSQIGPWGTALALVVLGAILVLASAPYRIELAEYAGLLCLVAAGWVVLDSVGAELLEPYLVLLALFIAASSYRYASRASGRDVPLAADWAAVAVAAWIPALLAVSADTPATALTHTLWASGLSIVAIAAGIALKVRGYLFGGVAALVFVSVWRSFFLLIEFWWIVLGLIGVMMLVIALTWERQQLVLVRTGRIVRQYFGGWR